MVHRPIRFSRFKFVIIHLVLLTGLLSACSQGVPQAASTLTPPTVPVGASPAAIGQQLPVESVQAVHVPVVKTADTFFAECMIGVWMVTDMQQSIAEAYSRSQSPLQFHSVTGETRYTFDENGGMEITFNDLTASLSGTIEGKEIKARNLMFGTATAQYRVDEKNREIVFSSFGGDGIQFATEINGQVLAQGDFPTWRAFTSNLAGSNPNVPSVGPTRVVSEAYAAITCAGDEMRLQAIDPVPGPEMKLRRVVD